MPRYNKKYKRGRRRNSGEGWPEGMLAGQGHKYDQMLGAKTYGGITTPYSHAKEIWTTDLWNEYSALGDIYHSTYNDTLQYMEPYVAAGLGNDRLGDTAQGFGPDYTTDADGGMGYINSASKRLQVEVAGNPSSGVDMADCTIYAVIKPDNTGTEKIACYGSLRNSRMQVHQSASSKQPGMRWGANIWTPTTEDITDWAIVRWSGRSSDSKKSISVNGNSQVEDTSVTWGSAAGPMVTVSTSSSPFLDSYVCHFIVIQGYFDENDSRDADTLTYLWANWPSRISPP